MKSRRCRVRAPGATDSTGIIAREDPGGVATGIDAKRFTSTRRHPPYRPVAVFGYQQRAVVGHRDADRAAPNRIVVGHEAGDKILVLTGRDAVLCANADHLVAGAARSVP